MEDLSFIPERGEQEKHGDDDENPATEKYEATTGGLIKQLLHNLVSTEEIQENEEQEEGEHINRSSSRVAEEETTENGAGGDREEVSDIRKGDSANGSGKGGISISELISTIFHQGEDDGKEGNKEENRAEAKEIQVNENDGPGVGDIINNLVSHLPTSLPDDAAPTTDEATILIHSIVHD